MRVMAEAMQADSEVRKMEVANEKAKIDHNKDLAMATLKYQSEYLKDRPKQNRLSWIILGIISLVTIALLGFIYVHDGEDFVIKILGGGFYLLSIYFSYRFGIKRGENSTQTQNF